MIVPITAELCDSAGAQVGEGPSWDARSDTLTWVDITAGVVHVADGTGRRISSHQVGQHVGAALPAAAGGWLLATQQGFSVMANSGKVSPLLVVHESPLLRFNDAKCDPRGIAFAGTMPYSPIPGVAALYRLDPGPTATIVLDRLTLANGLGWSPDGRTLWFTDSATQTIAAYDYHLDDGTIGALRTSIIIPSKLGMPDGLCVDGDGCVWTALWGGSAVHRYTPEGNLDCVIRLPVEQVTSCTFGGPDGHTLFITTAVHEMTEIVRASQPLAGGLFAVSLPQSGPAATPWETNDSYSK